MSTISSVSVGLKSCVFAHKSGSSKPSIPPERSVISERKASEIKECINGDLGDSGWSFLQALGNQTEDVAAVAAEEEEAYVHPLVKRSASTLSTKSLEMCTESLGSETGSDISESVDEFPSLLPEKENFPAAVRSKKQSSRTGSCFPPPLTSISGSDGVQVRPHREGGRLVITAVAVTLCTSLFEVERSVGRLRLSLRKTEDFEVFEDGENDEICSCDDEEEEKGGGEDGGAAGDDVFPVAIPASRCKESESRSGEMQSWAGRGPYCVAIS